MRSSFARALGVFFGFGLLGTGFGCYLCAKGHNYHVAAEHEATVVGQIVRVPASSKGSYRYEFSVNGVKMDDSSKICSTPLAPDACDNYGPVLVYYSYEPYPNSLLQSFTVAGNNAFLEGRFSLAIGLPLLVLSCAAFAFLRHKNRSKEGRSGPDGESDVIQIAPGE